jgi:hypothetical protein
MEVSQQSGLNGEWLPRLRQISRNVLYGRQCHGGQHARGAEGRTSWLNVNLEVKDAKVVCQTSVGTASEWGG